MIARWTLAVAICTASPALATLDEVPTDAPYRGICLMSEICTSNGACGFTPALGELLLVTDADGTQLGRDDADLAPVDRFSTLQDALPLPEIEGFRRTFLVDLPADGRIRRFAVHVQIIDGDTGAPTLRPQYFVLACVQVPA